MLVAVDKVTVGRDRVVTSACRHDEGVVATWNLSGW
jgi:hypothetical protein